MKYNKLSIVCFGLITISMIGISYVTYNITRNGLNNNAFVNRTLIALSDFKDLEKNLTRIKLTKAIYIFGSIQNLNISKLKQYKQFCPYIKYNLHSKLVSIIEEKVKIKKHDKILFNKNYVSLNALCQQENKDNVDTSYHLKNPFKT